MWNIEQRDGKWVLTRDGEVVAELGTQGEALQALVSAAIAPPGEPVAPSSRTAGRRWRGPIAMSVMTGDGRDFSKTTWSWRDPALVPLPLMDQTSTDMGHFGATWVGVLDELSMDGDTVMGGGYWHDSPEAEAALARMEAQGRLGVSVDPGEVDAEDVCTEMDAEGWCLDGYTQFNAYQIIGLTITPFPAFEGVFIEDADAPEGDAQVDEPAAGDETAEPIAASASLAAPPRSWFEDPKLERGARLAISDEGRVTAWVAEFGVCHLAWQDRCTTAPSELAIELLHSGSVKCADGSLVATGPLLFKGDHASTDVPLATRQVVDHYANTCAAWADVAFGVTPGVGIWCSGAVRPEAHNELTLRVLRGCSLSGDWRPIGGVSKLVAVLTVNVPGFPRTPRALAASASDEQLVASAQRRVRVVNGEVVAMQGIGMVLPPCEDCDGDVSRQLGSAARRVNQGNERSELLALARALDAQQRAILDRLDRIDRRTVPQLDAARDRLAQRIRG